MAISVRKNFHFINPSTELQIELVNLQMAGALAKVLGEDRIYHQLKDIFNTLKDQWESSTKDFCKKILKQIGSEVGIYI